MLPIRHCATLAVHALRRNRLQTGLAILGMTVGVGALVTSVALGRGAQRAIDSQLRAAGANVIVVTAGNYLHGGGNMGTVHLTPSGGPSSGKASGDMGDHNMSFRRRAGPDFPTGSLIRTSWAPMSEEPASRSFYLPVHFEDDPFAVHDHPTAAQRLGDSMAGLGAAATLTRQDADAIRQIPGVQYVASGIEEDQRLQAVGDSDTWFTYMRATESDLPRIRTGWTFPYGRFFDRKEVDASKQVIVLGRVVSDRLFGSGVNPVGRTVLLWHQRFQVIGLVGSRSWAAQPAPGDHEFDAFYVPVTTIQRLLDLSKLNNITVTTALAGRTTYIAREIVDLMRKRHKITNAMPDDFTVRTQAQIAIGHGLPPELAHLLGANMAGVDQLTIGKLAASLRRANFTMLSLLAGVAAVSLLVGGIGIMNLLLLSVTERTREIGLRVAVGARRGDVIAQFVSEAVLLSLVGGLLGTVAGALASGSLEQFFQYSVDISGGSALLAVAVAAALGIAFGVYPARRAAQLDPIEALHHE
jgi:putative ABC transport system permease protein